MISAFYWNPPKEAFKVPFIDHYIVWYGILFVCGFILGYFLINPLLARFLVQNHISPDNKAAKRKAYELTDRLCWFVILGTVIGARLGEVFFYDWEYFKHHPTAIFKIWHGGLASHGGVAGVMIALFLYAKWVQREIPQLSFLRLLDFTAIPSALVASFIRLGNFMNQEIVGKPTDLPWGILFAHPADGLSSVPRHPVQLYEAAAYFVAFIILWLLWKYHYFDKKPGGAAGLLFIFIFGSRFVLEFWKAPIDSVIHHSFLTMGQFLSIPFILLGLVLWIYSCGILDFKTKKY